MNKSRRRYNAIRFTIYCGMELSKNKDIAKDYVNGLSLEKIAKKHKINQLFDLRPGQNYAKNIVRFALIGNEEDLLGPVYQGLMKKDEFSEYAKDHMKKRWKNAGKETYRNNSGIHGRDLDQRIEDSLNGVRSRNQEPWKDEEIILAKILSNKKEYQHRDKKSNKKIATELNQIYHSNDVRTPEAVSYIFRQRTDYINSLMRDNDLINKIITIYFSNDV